MDWLIANWGTVVQVLTGLISVASIICAMTDTPSDDEFVGKIYKLLELFAINVGKAKQ